MAKNLQPPNQPLRGERVSVAQLAKLMAVSPASVREFMVAGMPVYEGGGPGKPAVLSSADCIQWLRYRGMAKAGRKPNAAASPEPESDPKRRMELLKLEQAEIDLLRERGEIVLMSELEPFAKGEAVKLRTRLLDIVRDYREQWGEEIAADLERRIRSTLNGFSDGLIKGKETE